MVNQNPMAGSFINKKRWLVTTTFLAIILAPSVSALADEAEEWFHRGNGFRQKGQLMDAIGAYEQSIKLNSAYWVTHYNLGLAYKKTGMFAKSADAFQRALKLVPDNLDIHLNLGNVYNYLENWESAIHHLNLVIHRRQGDAVAHGGLGWALYNYKRGPPFRLLIILNLRTSIEIFKDQNRPEAVAATQKTLNEVLISFGMGASDFDLPL